MSSGAISLLSVWTNSIHLIRKNRQLSLMVHTLQKLEDFKLKLRLEIQQHLGSLKHVINIIIWMRDTGCYSLACGFNYV
jgi:hypothetical protein